MQGCKMVKITNIDIDQIVTNSRYGCNIGSYQPVNWCPGSLHNLLEIVK